MRTLTIAAILLFATGCGPSSEPERKSAAPAPPRTATPVDGGAAGPKGSGAPQTAATPDPAASAADAAPEPAKAEAPKRVELPSGLIIEDIKTGEGRECPPGATITIHYRGTLDDGTEFDSSYKRGGPATFPLPQLIKGWQEGIPGMKVGGIRRLIIPYQLAYGEAARPNIPARSRLTFEIELFGVR